MTALEAIAHIPVAATIPCKCCGVEAMHFGVADFSKSCEERAGVFLPRTGIPVHYYRCRQCGLIFTAALDHFTQADFVNYIYNAEYPLVDPEFAQARPMKNARVISSSLGRDKSIRILDYGGGDGLTARLLQQDGFEDVVCYDPFFSATSQEPAGKFDCIFCFEVLEHSTNPKFSFNQILSMLKEPGIVVFTTVFQPPDIERTGISWTYIGPRNGHVSLYTPAAVRAIVEPLGYRLVSFNQSSHVLVKQVPPFAAHLGLPV